MYHLVTSDHMYFKCCLWWIGWFILAGSYLIFAFLVCQIAWSFPHFLFFLKVPLPIRYRPSNYTAKKVPNNKQTCWIEVNETSIVMSLKLPIQDPSSNVADISVSGCWSCGIRIAENPIDRPALRPGRLAIIPARN